jgi:hypothetical protein
MNLSNYDPDMDNDSILSSSDNRRLILNPDQADDDN